MRELDLEALLKEKREELTSVSITAVDSWLKGGIAFVGLFASLKWLFTKKMWLMLTSISSISIVTILAIVQLNSTPSTPLKSGRNVRNETKILKPEVKPEKVVETKTNEYAPVHQGFMTDMFKMTVLTPNQLNMTQETNLIEPVPFKSVNVQMDNESKDHFSRIDANGFVHFILVNGSSCSIQNTIPSQDGGTLLDYSIKNGTLYLNSANENKATDLIITVTDLEKIELNGFCEMITNSTFESTDLEIEVNGFTNLTLDLNVKDLEIDMNGETKGQLNLKGKNLEFESNGLSDVEIECDFVQSRMKVNGLSKIKFVGTSVTTELDVNGESHISAEEFISQELFLKMNGSNKKLETVVTAKLDVEISGKNSVVISGSPQIVHQEVTEGSKLKIK